MTPYDRGYEDGYLDRREQIEHTDEARGLLHSRTPYPAGWSEEDESAYQLGYAHGCGAARREQEARL